MISLKEVRGKTTAVFTFGRMNPPTIGHQKLVEKVLSEAQKNKGDGFIFVSQTQDAKKNPLSADQKIQFLKLGIKQASKNIVKDKKVRTPFEALESLIQKGYQKIIFVVGSDRVAEFKRNMSNFLDKEYPEIDFSVISAGARDPDADGVSGISASKMREAAEKNDFKTFSSGCLSGLNDRQKKELFNVLRRNMKVIDELTEMSINPGHSMDLPRCNMPQIANNDLPDFIEYLSRKGVTVLDTRVRLKHLKPTQREINVQNVHDKLDSFVRGNRVKKFIVSKDNRILDGHHQMFALKMIGRQFVPAYRVDLNMEDLLKVACKYPKATRKTID